MAIVFVLMTLIFGIGLYSVITGSLLPFVIADFPVGITITNIILGIVLFIVAFVVLSIEKDGYDYKFKPKKKSLIAKNLLKIASLSNCHFFLIFIYIKKNKNI